MPSLALAFSTTDTPTADQLLAVDTGLEQHNHAVAPLSDVRPLAAFATAETGAVVGGAVGRTWGKCCELLQLWVAPERRSHGVGSRLLQEFEAHARTRGCTTFYLTTLSYQAPAFYGRHGYTVLAQIAGYPNGIVKFLMHRAEARPLIAHQGQATMPSAAAVAPPDFDFMIGDWAVAHRRLNIRLSGCTDWTEFSGTSSTRKILRGFGNVEDNVLHFPEGSVHATAVRSFDPKARTWAIWWLDGRSPHHLDVPVVGQFAEGVGSFYADDVLDGKPIRVRFLWHANPDSQPRWEQAFSVDGGSTWETNWVMHFQRVAACQGAPAA